MQAHVVIVAPNLVEARRRLCPRSSYRRIGRTHQVSLIAALKRHDKKRGVAALCIGEATAMAIELL